MAIPIIAGAAGLAGRVLASEAVTALAARLGITEARVIAASRLGALNDDGVVEIDVSGSSVIDAIRWDIRSEVLTVVLTSGRSYDYPSTSQSTVEEFANSGSKGSFYNSRIKGNGFGGAGGTLGGLSRLAISTGLRPLR
ncbi:MAG: KTSC domain-containing protein [Hyphomicrobium sp.]